MESLQHHGCQRTCEFRGLNPGHQAWQQQPLLVSVSIFIQLYLQNEPIHYNTSDNMQRAVCLQRQLTSSIPFVRQFQMAVFLKLRQKYVSRPFLSIDSSSVTNHQK